MPSVKSDAKQVKKQAAAAFKEAKNLLTTALPRDTIQLGNGGRTGAEILAMYPGAMTVPTGTTLTFVMSRFSVEAHTATTGPGDPWTDPSSFLGKISDSIRISPPFDQAGVYPSDPRGDPALLTPSLHGNGFWNSGFMDRADSTPQPKTSAGEDRRAGDLHLLLHAASVHEGRRHRDVGVGAAALTSCAA